MKIKHLAILILLSLAACKSSKKATATPAKTVSKSLDLTTILNQLAQNEVKANWMAGGVGVDYNGKPMNVSASMEVRFRRDSVIWVNVKKLFINVGRAKITKDSVFVLNNLESTYVATDFSYLEKRFGIPVNFTVIQNILLGNPIFLIEKEKLKVESDSKSGDILLRGSDDKWQTSYAINPTTMQLKEMTFAQPFTERMLKISYEDYRALANYNNGKTNFSYLRTINIESPQTGKSKIVLEIDADGLEINIPKNIKFEIPAGYEKVD